jgi:hypothetical protein
MPPYFVTATRQQKPTAGQQWASVFQFLRHALPHKTRKGMAPKTLITGPFTGY